MEVARTYTQYDQTITFENEFTKKMQVNALFARLFKDNIASYATKDGCQTHEARKAHDTRRQCIAKGISDQHLLANNLYRAAELNPLMKDIILEEANQARETIKDMTKIYKGMI